MGTATDGGTTGAATVFFLLPTPHAAGHPPDVADMGIYQQFIQPLLTASSSLPDYIGNTPSTSHQTESMAVIQMLLLRCDAIRRFELPPFGLQIMDNANVLRMLGQRLSQLPSRTRNNLAYPHIINVLCALQEELIRLSSTPAFSNAQLHATPHFAALRDLLTTQPSFEATASNPLYRSFAGESAPLIVKIKSHTDEHPQQALLVANQRADVAATIAEANPKKTNIHRPFGMGSFYIVLNGMAIVDRPTGTIDKHFADGDQHSMGTRQRDGKIALVFDQIHPTALNIKLLSQLPIPEDILLELGPVCKYIYCHFIGWAPSYTRYLSMNPDTRPHILTHLRTSYPAYHDVPDALLLTYCPFCLDYGYQSPGTASHFQSGLCRLPAARTAIQAVYQATEDYLGTIAPADSWILATHYPNRYTIQLPANHAAGTLADYPILAATGWILDTTLDSSDPVPDDDFQRLVWHLGMRAGTTPLTLTQPDGTPLTDTQVQGLEQTKLIALQRFRKSVDNKIRTWVQRRQPLLEEPAVNVSNIITYEHCSVVNCSAKAVRANKLCKPHYNERIYANFHKFFRTMFATSQLFSPIMVATTWIITPLTLPDMQAACHLGMAPPQFDYRPTQPDPTTDYTPLADILNNCHFPYLCINEDHSSRILSNKLNVSLWCLCPLRSNMYGAAPPIPHRCPTCQCITLQFQPRPAIIPLHLIGRCQSCVTQLAAADGAEGAQPWRCAACIEIITKHFISSGPADPRNLTHSSVLPATQLPPPFQPPVPAMALAAAATADNVIETDTNQQAPRRRKQNKSRRRKKHRPNNDLANG